MKICSVEGCGQIHKAKGLCYAHWRESRKEIVRATAKRYHENNRSWVALLAKDRRDRLDDCIVRNRCALPKDAPSEVVEVHRLIIQIRRETRS